MNAVILRNGKYHVQVQLQDEVLNFGPFDTETLAREKWAKESNDYNRWGKPEDIDLYEAKLEEVLVKVAKKSGCCCNCKCRA